MYLRLWPCLAWTLILAVPSWATPPTPMLRYVFDTSGTQRDLGTAPTANGTLAGSAAVAYNSPLSFSCRSLDLTGTGSGYVTTGGDVDKIDALPAMTATCWINMRSAPAKQDCLLSDKPSGTPPSGQGGWELRITSSGTPTADNFQLEFSVMESYGTYTNSQGAASPSINAASQWVFVAITYSSDRKLGFYTGTEYSAPTQIASTGSFAIPLLQNNTEFRVGSAASEPATDRTPPAWIDDVRIYNQVLSLADLNQVRMSNLFSPATLAVPAFYGIGDLPGGGCVSSPQGLSADGSTVVGYSSGAAGIRGFRWRYNNMEALVDPTSGTNVTVAYGASADGSVVVGNRSLGGGQYEAFRWDAAGDGVSLGDLPGGDVYGFACGVSGDGGTTVGYGVYQSPLMLQAFQFTTAMTPLGFLPGDDQSAAFAISRDGTVIVGASASSSSGQACHWENGMPVPLGDLDGGTPNSAARQISADNQTIVGYGNSASGQEAAFWRAGRIFGLGDLPGGSFLSIAYSVSARGSYIVGQGTVAGSPTNQAFIWDRRNGMRTLKTVLETDYGLDLTGWTLTFAAGISDDGSIITGGGYNPPGNSEAWIARLPLPPAIADLDGDGGVDGTDVEWFAACATGPAVPYAPDSIPADCPLSLDVLGLLAADFDWDGDVDQDDFGVLQLCFSGFGAEPPPECRG